MGASDPDETAAPAGPARLGLARSGPTRLAAAAARRGARLVEQLLRAIDAGEAFLAFQPVHHAHERGRVLFHEGLFRFRDASGAEVPARDFMPAAERTPAAQAVDRAALALALRELADAPGLRLSVNLSARTVGDPEWRAILRAAAARDPAIGRRLVVEITESSALGLPGLVLETMAELRAHGVTLALDDFGAGHSSLGYLKDYRFDILKIDGRFAAGIDSDPDSRALVAPVVALARHFGMLTVAERVETEAQALAFAALGVDALQGFHLGRPTARPLWRTEARREAI